MTKREQLLDPDFLRETADRAIKSAAQAVILGAGLSDATPIDAFSLDWKLAFGFGAGGAVLSVLTSLASGSIFRRRGTTPASIL